MTWSKLKPQPKHKCSITEGSEVQTIDSRKWQKYIIRWYGGVQGSGTHSFHIKGTENQPLFKVQLDNVQNTPPSRSFNISIELIGRPKLEFPDTVHEVNLSPDYTRLVIKELTDYGVAISRKGISDVQAVEARIKIITDKFRGDDEATKKAARNIEINREGAAICCTAFFFCPMISDHIFEPWPFLSSGLPRMGRVIILRDSVSRPVVILDNLLQCSQSIFGMKITSNDAQLYWTNTFNHSWVSGFEIILYLACNELSDMHRLLAGMN
jgi:hypothetical protein